MSKKTRGLMRKIVVWRFPVVPSIVMGVAVLVAGIIVSSPNGGRPNYNKSAADGGVFSASPNPIQVCDGSGVGTTTLVWNVSGATEIEVRKDGEFGSVVAKGGGTGNQVVSAVASNAQYFLYATSVGYRWQYNRTAKKWSRILVETRSLVSSLAIAHTVDGCAPISGQSSLRVGLNTDGGSTALEQVSVKPGGTYYVLAQIGDVAGGEQATAYQGKLDDRLRLCAISNPASCQTSSGAWGDYTLVNGKVRIDLPGSMSLGIFNVQFKARGSDTGWSNEVSVRVEDAVAVDRLPTGQLEVANCQTISGWARDPDVTSPIAVHVYDGNTFVSGHMANVDSASGANNGFSIPTPAVFKDGRSHAVKVFAINNATGAINPEITGSPKTIQCQPAVTIGGDTFTISPWEILVTKSQRDAAGLIHWADGQFGVVSLGNGQYDFFAGNSVKTARTRGTLANPAQQVLSTGTTIQGLKLPSNYASGGPVYKDPTSGKLVLIYHAEHWITPGGSQGFHSWLGMAVSENGGETWTDLGRIISAGVGINNHVEIGSGSYAIKDGYMYIAYHDFLTTGEYSIITFARASVVEIAAAVMENRAPEFKKYYNGSWNEPGVGGRSTERIVNSPAYGHLSLSYNTAIQKFILVSAKYPSGDPALQGLYMSTSSDGVNWTEPTFIQRGNWMIYTTQIGTGTDTRRTGRSFYIYYVYYTTNDTPWRTAEIVRQLVTIQ